VPKPYDFLEGVLLMELVADEYGDAAPRLNDVVLEPDQARESRVPDFADRADAVYRSGAR
jgi:serine/threonine-protein kinase RIO1